ncbi:prepilin peptidase [Xanthobacter sp. V4C-4]|uniref:A24 family peptidase n=1 Tax=Xanthobacter cornucopiae TaxID=3119924 RepID=UPI0037269B8E
MDRMHLLNLLLLGLYPALLCTAIGTDLSRRVIPNALVAALIAGFAMVAGLSPLPDLSLRLLVAGSVTAAGFALFAQDVIGAGDAKLAGALALWLDPAQVPLFLIACGLIGAALTLAATVKARATRAPSPVPASRLTPFSRPLARLAASGETLPYGVALAGAGLLLHPYSSLMVPG